MKQEQKVIEYFIQYKNKPKHFEQVSNDLNILVPNVRRILGQGTLKGVFNRVATGVYEFAHYNSKEGLSRNTAIKIEKILYSTEGNLLIRAHEFNMLLNSVNDNEKEILKSIIK